MRILYVLYGCGVLITLLLWLGFYNVIRRKLAVILSVISIAAGGFLVLQAVLPDNSFYGRVISSIATEEKVIALTFDDGPYPPYTEQLLKLLEKEQVKATFFVVGEKAEKHPEIIGKEKSLGHELALHSYVHRDQLKLNAFEVQENLVRGKEVLQRLTGVEPLYFRPPHGFKDWTVLEESTRARLEAVNWSIIPRDWTNPGAEVIAERVLAKANPGAIVLLHDGDSPRYTASREQTIEATREIIRKLRAQGYSFVTISELKQYGKTSK